MGTKISFLIRKHVFCLLSLVLLSVFNGVSSCNLVFNDVNGSQTLTSLSVSLSENEGLKQVKLYLENGQEKQFPGV